MRKYQRKWVYFASVLTFYRMLITTLGSFPLYPDDFLPVMHFDLDQKRLLSPHSNEILARIGYNILGLSLQHPFMELVTIGALSKTMGQRRSKVLQLCERAEGGISRGHTYLCTYSQAGNSLGRLQLSTETHCSSLSSRLEPLKSDCNIHPTWQFSPQVPRWKWTRYRRCRWSDTATVKFPYVPYLLSLCS